MLLREFRRGSRQVNVKTLVAEIHVPRKRRKFDAFSGGGRGSRRHGGDGVSMAWVGGIQKGKENNGCLAQDVNGQTLCWRNHNGESQTTRQKSVGMMCVHHFAGPKSENVTELRGCGSE